MTGIPGHLKPPDRLDPAPPPAQAGEKPTAEELNARILEIMDLDAKGLQRREIIKYVQTKTDWGIAPSSVDRYIRSAKERLTRAGKDKAEYAIAVASRCFREVYGRAMIDKDYPSALKSIEKYLRLHGVNVEDKAPAQPMDGDGQPAGPMPIAHMHVLMHPRRATGVEDWNNLKNELTWQQAPGTPPPA